MNAFFAYLYRRPVTFYRNLFWFLLILILIISSIPALPEPEIYIHHEKLRLDHLFHWGEYASLVFLFAFWRLRTKPASAPRILVYTFLLGLLIASFDETHQLFVPGRHFTFADWLSNLLGVITGILFSLWVWNSARRRSLISPPSAQEK